MQLIALLPLLASIADARHLPLRRHRQNQVNKQHHQHARAMGMDAGVGFGLDERGLPITATTTVVVEMTSTQTVWVPPTGQVPMQPEPSASASMTDSASSSESASASASGSDSDSSTLPSISTEAVSPSPSPTSPPSESASSTDMDSSMSSSDWISSAISASASDSASDWSSSAISTPSPSANETESASPSSTSLSSWDEPSSSMASASASASASSTWSESASVPTPSANATSIAQSSASGSVSDASSISQSDSLTEASYSSSSISGSASASTSISATSSPSVSASANTTASMSDWAASSSSSAASASTSGSASFSSSVSSSTPASASSTSSVYNSTSASASSSSAPSSSSSSSDQSSSSLLPSSTSASVSAASASPSSSSGHHSVNVPRTLMAGYYPDWSAWTLPPESVDWTKFDVVDFAFAIPTWDGRLEFTQWDSSELLNRLVAGAHRNGKKVKLSIGGWTGSKYFSSLVAESSSRTNFVNNCVQAYWAYSLDGIDIDWEYPNSGGAQGNIISSADSANFLLFLRELRAALPQNAMISLATQVWPFAGPDGRPLGDVSGFAKVIDWIIIMNYDIWGSSDNPGPNAPLNDACGTSTQPLANAYASVASWTSAGMPASKIVLGVPAYGYLQKSNARQLRTRDYIPPSAEEMANFTSSLVPIEKRQSGIVTVRNGGGGDNNGQIGFGELVKQGALRLDSAGKYIGAGGFYREWDRCSSTPWIRSSHSGQVVTYDDPDSLSMKGQFARQSGLRGVNMFSMDGDWTGSNWPLTDSLRSGMGI